MLFLGTPYPEEARPIYTQRSLFPYRLRVLDKSNKDSTNMIQSNGIR